MGVLTYMESDFDEQRQVQRIFAITKFSINNRSSLNRVAGRAAVSTGVGQRTLVAAAYDEVGIDLVYNKGLGVRIPPEEKYEKAQDIEFYSIPAGRSSEFFDITNIPEDKIPSGKLWDRLKLDIGSFREDEVLYVWEIPYEVGGRRR